MEDDSESKTHKNYNATFETLNATTKLSQDDEEDTSSIVPQDCSCSDTANSSKTNMIKQNATSFHPLMHSSVSQDFPDLIPENQRSKMFRQECHSSPTEVQLANELEAKINMALSNYSYDEKIQGKKILLIVNIDLLFLFQIFQKVHQF